MNLIDKLVLGTVQLGLPYGINNNEGKPTLEQAFNILRFAQENNITTLDTATAYGDSMSVIGNYNNQHPKFKVITKFHLNNFQIKEQALAALERLKVVKIEAYLFHSFTDFINADKKVIIQLKELINNNIIGKIGVSVYTNEEFADAIIADYIDLIQVPFNLLDNKNQRGILIHKAKQAGKIIHTRSCFLQGLFFMDKHVIPPKLTPLVKYIDQIKEIASNFDVPINRLALHYVFNTTGIDGVLIGVETINQLKNNLTELLSPLNQEAIKAVDGISVEEIELLNPSNWNK